MWNRCLWSVTSQNLRDLFLLPYLQQTEFWACKHITKILLFFFYNAFFMFTHAAVWVSFYYYIFSSFTFQMLSQRSLCPHPQASTLLPNPPTPASWPWHSPVLGNIKFARATGLFFQWWPTRPSSATYAARDTSFGVLVSSYCVSIYRVADPFSSLGTFSCSSIEGPVFHPIDDCEHPLLYLPCTGLASQETALSGSFQQNQLIMRWISGWGSLWMVHPFVSAPNFVSVTPSMGIVFPILRRSEVVILWLFFLSFMCFANCIWVF